MAADIATLAIRVEDGQARGALSGLEGALGKVAKVAGVLGLTLGAGAMFRKFITETSEAQFALAQLEARVKSTGGAAGLAVPQLTAYASEMQRLTTFSDEAVMGAQALLLTFTKIKGDVFPEATKAVANLATAMGTDMKGAAIQLGKALQDPEQGLLALRRSGVSFSESQQEVIKQLFATGKEVEAQRMILKELEKEFGGAAEAARQTFGGALAGLKNAWGELFEVSKADSAGIIDALNRLTAFLPRVRDGFVMAFGGVRLLYVDMVVAVEEGNAKIYAATAKLLQGLAGVALAIPGLTQEASKLLGAAASLQTQADTTRAAFAAWKTEQEQLITGTGLFAANTITLATAMGALADNMGRAASAKVRLGIATAGIGVSMSNMPGVSDALQQQASQRMTQINDERNERYVQAGLAAEKKLAEGAAQIRENFLRQLQQTFASGIADMLTRGLDSWRSFFGSIRDMFARLFADMASAKLMDKIMGTSTSTASAGSLVGMGAAAAFAGILLSVSTSIAQTSAMNAQAARQFADSTIKWEAAFGRLTKPLSALDAQFQSLADSAITAAQAAIQGSPAARYGHSGVGMYGATTGAMPGALGSMADLDAYIAQLTAMQGHGKNVAQDRELATLLNQLQKLREAYREQSAAADAATASTEAARVAQDALTAARERDNLQLRLLTAQGDDAGAFTFRQQMERQQAIDDKKSQAYLDLLNQVLAAELTARNAATGGQSPSTTSGSTGGIVTRQMSASVTTYQGDRMVDELRSARIILRQIEVNTRGLRAFGPTVDAALGRQMASREQFVGNAMLS